MPVTMREIANSSSLSDPELRIQAENTPTSSYSRLYVLRDGSDDVGFAVLDHAPDELGFYSLWIARRYRGRGYGRTAVMLVLEIALEAGFNSIALRPVPLDDDWDEERLRRFYGRAGYRDDPDDTSIMRLNLASDEL